jgi:hypothetical protein
MPIVFPLLDFQTAALIVGAGDTDIRYRVELLPSVVLTDGGTPRTVVAPPIPPLFDGEPLAACQAVSIPIDTSSYPQQVGAVRLVTTGQACAALDVRTGSSSGLEALVDRHALLEAGCGGLFRIPFAANPTRDELIRVAVTAPETARQVRFQTLPSGTPGDPIRIEADHTLLFVSGLAGSGTLQITADGPVAVSAVIRAADPGRPARTRIYPLPF